MLTVPSEILASGLCGAPFDYEWDTDVSDDIIFPAEDRLPRLAKAYWQCDQRTGYGLALATAEWSVWRFYGIVDLGDAQRRLEAGYAAVVDARYADLPEPDEPFPETLQDAHGPLKLARMLISSAHGYHLQGDSSVHAVGFSLALLALHLYATQAAVIEAWLERTLRRCHALHPPADVPLEAQRPVARAFFFSPANAPDSAPTELNGFLAALKPAENRYLRSTDALRELGFTGTPYTLA